MFVRFDAEAGRDPGDVVDHVAPLGRDLFGAVLFDREPSAERQMLSTFVYCLRKP